MAFIKTISPEESYATDFGRSPGLIESPLNAGDGGAKSVSSVNAIDTGWYVCGS